jgi:chromosome segregation ATPase
MKFLGCVGVIILVIVVCKAAEYYARYVSPFHAATEIKAVMQDVNVQKDNFRNNMEAYGLDYATGDKENAVKHLDAASAAVQEFAKDVTKARDLLDRMKTTLTPKEWKETETALKRLETMVEEFRESISEARKKCAEKFSDSKSWWSF